MRIDTALLEPLMDRARLSTRERETVRLECSGPLEDKAIAATMGCSVASVRTYRHRGRQKMLAAQREWDAEQLLLLGTELQEQDRIDVSTPEGFYRFLLQAMLPKRHPDHGPNIGVTWKSFDRTLGIEVTHCLEGAAHAGAMVSVRDLLR